MNAYSGNAVHNNLWFGMPSSSCKVWLMTTVDKCYTLKLPLVIECSDLLNDVTEITTPDIVQYFPHLQDIANIMPHYDPD